MSRSASKGFNSNQKFLIAPAPMTPTFVISIALSSYLIPAKSMTLHTGIAMIENNVESTTHLAALISSASYLAARSEVVEPAGILVSNTETPVINGSTCNK